MAKTIIQTIGPLYGEPVNGTVFGRPNGSVYVPSSNTISVSIPDTYDYVKVGTYPYGVRLVLCTSTGTEIVNRDTAKIVAEAQDLQSHISISLEDENGVTVGIVRNFSAGIFNTETSFVGDGDEDTAITANATYYVVAELVSVSGVAVATTRQKVTGYSE